MKYKKTIATLVLLMFSIYLASPALAGTFILRWDYSDADGDPMTQWRWWFDAADYSGATVKNQGLTADATQVDPDTYETTVDTSGLAPDGSHILKLQVHDGTEWSLEDTITINLDTANPSIIITDPSGIWENSDIVVNVQTNDPGSGIATREYAITNDTNPPASWTALASDNENLTINTDGEYYVHVQASDTVGNSLSTYKGPFQLDKTAPSLSITNESGVWESSDITVNIQHSDGGGSGIAIAQYKITNDTSKPSSGWATLASGNENIVLNTTGEFYIHVQIIDGANNETYSYEGPFQLDKTNPTDPTINASTTAWTNGDVTFTITPGTDANSGVLKTQYRIDSGTWTDYSTMVTVSDEGTHTIEAKSIDNVNNESNVVSETINIDKTLPTGSITSHSNGDYINGTITLSGTANDILSGLQTVEISTDNGSSYNPVVGTNNWTYDFTVPGVDAENTEYQVILRVTDNAGNQFETPIISLFKNSQTPVTTWTTVGNSYHNADINLEGQTSDANTVDFVTLTYQYDGGAEQPITVLTNTTNAEPFSWSYNFVFPDGNGNYTFLAKGTDKGALEETAVQITNVIYDTAGPTVNVVGPANTVRENITVTGSATDTNQETVSLTLDGNPVALDGAGNFTVNLTLAPGENTFVFEATDGAGNTTTQNYTVTRGQPDAPTVTPISNPDSIQYDWLAVADVDGYEISTDNTNWVDLGNVLTTTVNALTPNITETRYFRSYAGTISKMYSNSVTVTASTLAIAPTIDSVNVVDYQTIEVQMGLNGNPVNTELQVQVMDGLTEVVLTPWSTDTTVQINSLEGNKNYQINVRARNIEGTETVWVDAGIYLTEPTPADLVLTDVNTGLPLEQDDGIVLLNKLNFDLAITIQAGVTYKYKLSNNPDDVIGEGDPVYSEDVTVVIPADGVWYLIIEATNATGTTRTVQQVIADTTAPSFLVH